MLKPLRPKYHALYWDIAHAAANQSVAERIKVGAVVVTKTGMISLGWNGTPPGHDNECEGELVECGESPTGFRKKTKPSVIHAEQNAIDKMTRQGVPTEGAILFTTLSPCLECAKRISGLGFEAVIFDKYHDDLRGIELLIQAGVVVHHRHEQPSINEAS